MARSTFKVLFYVNGSKEKDGIVPIMGRVTINGTVAQFSCKLEKAREFDPFGHAGLTPSGIIRLTPSGKIKMTPVDDTAGEFFCSFENPCPGTAGFNVKYYKI